MGIVRPDAGFADVVGVESVDLDVEYLPLEIFLDIECIPVGRILLTDLDLATAEVDRRAFVGDVVPGPTDIWCLRFE
jgi:hypothetical protein